MLRRKDGTTVIREKKNNQKNNKKKLSFSTIIKGIVGVFLVAIIATVLFVFSIRGILYLSNHITTPNGVDESIYVSLGGQEQYLLIRGEDVNNPVIIWLHGGPSGPDAFMNYRFQKYLVGKYTFVNWDQRGCGRTYFRNSKIDPNNQTATFEQALVDLDELVNYVLDRFDKEKVILVGHSYGTALGSRYTLSHPDKVAAYVGIGQAVAISESETYSYEDALEKAKAQGDDTTDMEAAYRAFSENMTLPTLIHLREYTLPYHPVENEANTIWQGVISPYMWLNDVRWFFKQVSSLEKYTALNQQLFDFTVAADVRDYGLEYQVPVGFISGSEDWITPVKYTEDYYKMISAPKKDFVLIDGLGHAPNYDSPEAFCRELDTMLDELLK